MTDRGSNINKVFDAWNRIIDIDQGSGSYLARYKYNGLGQTIKRTNSSTLFDTYYYFSAENQIVEELKVSDGSSISWYVWGSQYIDDIVMRGKASASDDRYYVLDARNNVTTVLSNAGSVQTRFVYDAYGMPKQLSADWSTWQTITEDLHLFTGRLFHKDHAQTDYRARLQDPELGVFVQRDPIVIWGDQANWGNGYAYVGNDPMNNVDPLGQNACDQNASPVFGGEGIGFASTRTNAETLAQQACRDSLKDPCNSACSPLTPNCPPCHVCVYASLSAVTYIPVVWPLEVVPGVWYSKVRCSGTCHCKCVVYGPPEPPPYGPEPPPCPEPEPFPYDPPPIAPNVAVVFSSAKATNTTFVFTASKAAVLWPQGNSWRSTQSTVRLRE
jgi:RHS repeat-associated protein